MIPLLAILLLALSWTAPARAAPGGIAIAPLVVRATLTRSGALIVTWPPVAGAMLGCVVRRNPDRPLGCTYTATYQLGPGSVDAALVVGPAEVVEVRVQAASGAFLAIGQARVVGPQIWLPVVGRPPPRWQVLLPIVRRR